MDGLTLTSVSSVTNVSEMTPKEIQFWSQYIGRKYQQPITSDHIFDNNLKNVPAAEKIVIRTWTWIDPDDSIHTLLDMDGNMGDFYDVVVLFDEQPICDNEDEDGYSLYWRGDPFPGFDLDMFSLIRHFLMDASFDGIEKCITFDVDDEMAVDFLREHPRFIEMEKEARIN